MLALVDTEGKVAQPQEHLSALMLEVGFSNRQTARQALASDGAVWPESRL
jgi:hypothetical protein